MVIHGGGAGVGEGEGWLEEVGWGEWLAIVNFSLGLMPGLEHLPTLKPDGYVLHLASKLLHDICLPSGFLRP